MTDKIKILGFSGSLRKGSFNRMMLKAAQELVPDNAELEIFEIGALPMYNTDLESPEMPQVVKEFKAKIEAANAVLIVTPEFDHSISGALKSALEWSNRPYGKGSLQNKITGIMSASGGMLGGVRAQGHLREILLELNAQVLNRPEVIIPAAYEKVDKEGKVTDEKTREKIRELVHALAHRAAKEMA